jgi:acetyl esterase/lipase
LADAEQLALHCARARVPCHIQIWDNAPHAFQIAADFLPEARSAINYIGKFIRRHSNDKANES